MITKTGSKTATITINRAEDVTIRANGAVNLSGYQIKLAVRNLFTLTCALDVLDNTAFFMNFTAEQAILLGGKPRDYQLQLISPQGRRSVPLSGTITATGFAL